MFFKEIIKYLLLVLGIPFGILIASILLGLPSIVVNILGTMSIAYVYGGLLLFILNQGGRKNKFNKRMSLYSWMDELIDYDETLTHLLKIQINKYRVIDNLNIIKSSILRITKGKIETLQLYKAYYNQISKETGEELYFKTILTLLTSVAVYLLKDYITETSNININSGFLFILIVCITVAIIVGKINNSKSRNGLIIEIIDICIDEVRQKEKNSSYQNETKD